MIYDRVKEELLINKKIREDGRYIAIPWPNMPKLSSVIPGIQRSRYIIVTANSKVGKTQIGDFLFLYEPLDFLSSHPDAKLKIKIFYFSLEISKEDKILQMISNRIFKDYQITISTDNLRSYFNGYILEDKLVEIISSYEEYFRWVETVVEFIDQVRNPYGIYKLIRDYAKTHGKFYKNDGTEVIMNNGENLMYDYYVPNDPEEQVLIIVDNFNLLQPEKGEDLWSAMHKFSSDYALKIRDNFKYTLIGIQQQAADQEKQQFTFKGNSIIEKIRPSADGLGDCKLTARDCDLMIGLFAPYRYKIVTYPINGGYDINKLKDNYRELSILLNRRGGGNINLDLYFNGAANYFEELPAPNSKKMIEIYNQLQ